ncbi:hypothetical protein [Streptomyces sp. GESEQ-4]|uniref:hypothetical protein n=1 Tax=Streptomyces sp. GESEQ-4 TaxID=2812655 RepID=UPI001B32FE6F|nr:hypothetical protein [Streptomyces sp. GESEQ-4]
MLTAYDMPGRRAFARRSLGVRFRRGSLPFPSFFAAITKPAPKGLVIDSMYAVHSVDGAIDFATELIELAEKG